MRICFSGFNDPIVVDNSAISVLEIQNRVLFARVCASLFSEAGGDAVEPYSLWDGDLELKPGNQMLYVGNPLDLPWGSRFLAGALVGQAEKLLFEDEPTRREVEEAAALLSSLVSKLALQLDSDYSFGVDWELKRYLKSFGFGVDVASDESLIDKIIKFMLLAKDVSLDRVVIFVNLKLFLSESELDRFFEQAFFSNLSILLVENSSDSNCRQDERKYIIDQDLLEIWPSSPAGLPVSSQ